MDKQIDANTNTIVIKRQIQIEAISKAIYLVTDLFDLDEPLRLGLRKTAVEAVSSFDKGHAMESLHKLHSMIRISKDIQLISEMNARLLLNAIEGLRAKPEDRPVVDITGVLEVVSADLESVPENKVEVSENYSQGQVRQISQVYRPAEQPTQAAPATHAQPQKTPEGVQDRGGREVRFNEKDKEIIKDTYVAQPTGMDIGSRRKKILEIVRAKGQATINEFIDAIQGCSSKTIQRELTSLVLSGTLKKSGERRWSKYSLK